MPGITVQKGTEIALIDVDLVTLETYDETPEEVAFQTASQIQVATETETIEAIKLIVKGRLVSQKSKEVTITGSTITLTDNVFTPEAVKILSGGTVTYDTDGSLKHFEPPTPSATEEEKGKVCKLCAYTSQYDTSGVRIAYYKLTFPNCKGEPFTMGAQDGTFFVNTLTINSAPAKDEPPFTLDKVDKLPELVERVTNTPSEINTFRTNF